MKLGVFDSGIGGEAVAAALRIAFPDAEILTVNDREHLPYGDRSLDDITSLTDAAIQPLLDGHVDIVILACNSATAAAIETLRARYPEQKFIGLEPMVKPAAAASLTGTITICATPATLSSTRYQTLKQTYGNGTKIIEPDCSSWARLIEENAMTTEEIRRTIEPTLDQGADVVVLACTHYHWIRDYIENIAAGRAEVMDPSDAIARRVAQLLMP